MVRKYSPYFCFRPSSQTACHSLLHRLIILLLIALPSAVHAQPDTGLIRMDGGRSLHAGGGYSGSPFPDLGIAWAMNGRVGPHPQESALYLANELYFGPRLVTAPKIGAWAGGGAAGLGLGLNFLYYTDFSDGQVVFRPEIGVGLMGTKVYYGYNVRIGRSDFEAMSRSVFGFAVWFNRNLRKRRQ